MPVAYVALCVCPVEVVARPHEFYCRLKLVNIRCLLEELPALLGSKLILEERSMHRNSSVCIQIDGNNRAIDRTITSLILGSLFLRTVDCLRSRFHVNPGTVVPVL